MRHQLGTSAPLAALMVTASMACSPEPRNEPRPGDRWVESETGTAFRYVPAGAFLRGSQDTEAGRDDDETLHEVTLTAGYWIGETEVTQGQWREVTGGAPALMTGCGGDCPVERVSWFDAVTFANELSEVAGLDACYALGGCTGSFGGGCPAEPDEPSDWCRSDYVCEAVSLDPACDGFRLPTEAEWERASRAGTGTATYVGDVTLRGLNDGPELDPIAWYAGNSGADYPGAWDCSGWQEKQAPADTCGTQPVAGKTPNAWGLHDTIGNVWEWVWDRKGPYPTGAVTDPSGPASGSYRVRRGCSWSNIPDHCRAADRSDDEPMMRDRNWGLRLAVSTVPAR